MRIKLLRILIDLRTHPAMEASSINTASHQSQTPPRPSMAQLRSQQTTIPFKNMETIALSTRLKYDPKTRTIVTDHDTPIARDPDITAALPMAAWDKMLK